jgi:transposase
LLEKGVHQSEVARQTGVHRQSVSRWAQQLETEGRAGLKKAGRAGRKPRLSAEDLERIERGLKRGPESLGYDTGLWTSARGIEYHPGHVWRILLRLGWSCQRPTGRSLERDEAAIVRWKRKRWPEIKKKPKEKTVSSSSSTKAG